MKISYSPAVIFTACLASTLWSPGVRAVDFSDTALAYRYGSNFTEPARQHGIAKDILTLSHVNSGQSGLHALSLEGRYSDHNDSKKGSTDGATEYLFNYRYQLAAARVADQPLAFGPVRDMALMAGIDLTTKDTLFAPRKRAWVFGPVLKFDVPGFFDLALLYYKERNHKGIPGTPHPDHSFEGTWMLNAAWSIPFRLGSASAVFNGLFNRLGEKGKDFNDIPSAGETLLRANVMIDLGQALGLGKQTLMAGVGYEWWKNKYGTPAGIGTHTRTPTINVETHF
ncbi:MAG: nucleoside-binding protein [Betaproteobacteria bacterium]|nr:nucleoside-binding protein [Betaproteobacteria bacterium]